MKSLFKLSVNNPVLVHMKVLVNPPTPAETYTKSYFCSLFSGVFSEVGYSTNLQVLSPIFL